MFEEQPSPKMAYEGGESLSLRQPSLLENLKSRQLRAQSELDKINDAVTALEKNPEIASVIEKIAKVRGL